MSKKCLYGIAQVKWDQACAEHTAAGGGISTHGFRDASNIWLNNYFEDTAIDNIKHYLTDATKPYGMTVDEVKTRLDQMIKYMRHLPGGVGADNPAFSDTQHEVAFC